MNIHLTVGMKQGMIWDILIDIVNGVVMNIKHGSCCDLVEQKVNFWFTNSGELVIESELLSRLYDNFEPTSVKSRVVTLRNYLLQG